MTTKTVIGERILSLYTKHADRINKDRLRDILVGAEYLPEYENIESVFTKRGLKKEALAKVLGVKSRTIGSYTNGDRLPPTDTICEIADLFNCDPDYILGILPEDQLTYISQDLYELTGFKGDAAAFLLKKKPNEKLQWMLNNGLKDSILNIEACSVHVGLEEKSFQELPAELQDIINSCIEIEKPPSASLYDQAVSLASWIEKQSDENVSEYLKAFPNYQIANIVPYQTILEDISPGDPIEYDANKARLFDYCLSFIQSYAEVIIDRKVTLLNETTRINNMLLKLMDDEVNRYKSKFMKGDEK